MTFHALQIRWHTWSGGVRRLVNHWLGAGLDLVFPPDCVDCGEALEPGLGTALCETCRGKLQSNGPACLRCGCMLPAESNDCPRCPDAPFAFEGVVRLGSYEGALRSAVLRMKHPQQRPLSLALGALLADSRGDELTALSVDVVVPVPMHWVRSRWRGINGPEVIAERLARRLKVPMNSKLLVRRRRTLPQASLSVPRRKANVRGAFAVRPHADWVGARVLLVDDIMTTGATVNEASKTLRRAGVAAVVVAVLARAEGFD